MRRFGTAALLAVALGGVVTEGTEAGIFDHIVSFNRQMGHGNGEGYHARNCCQNCAPAASYGYSAGDSRGYPHQPVVESYFHSHAPHQAAPPAGM
ncbi:hypothetical protein [Lignipirellula cremea]|uniref:Uncharacterized protein n=1 Tax=Lignipirellula cremea TaxID=2528010 RepID=A0A518DMU9_9BACT|nr:hypothetical protein [Lignipirellula cremea]QDU93167.1 hypothetical protein Pla8534_09460 [Lignipirellula cremea]